MHEPPVQMPEQQADARRKGVRRTATLFVVIAVIIYAGFIISGMHR